MKPSSIKPANWADIFKASDLLTRDLPLIYGDDDLTKEYMDDFRKHVGYADPAFGSIHKKFKGGLTGASPTASSLGATAEAARIAYIAAIKKGLDAVSKEKFSDDFYDRVNNPFERVDPLSVAPKSDKPATTGDDVGSW